MKQKEGPMNVILKSKAHFYEFILNIVLLFFIVLWGKVNGNTNNQDYRRVQGGNWCEGIEI